LNFLLHRFLAVRDLGSEIAGIGAMLPDLWRMVDRRVRPVSARFEPIDVSDALDAVLSGIQHHLEVDRWFHAAEAFTKGERTATEAFRASGIEAPKLALFAHVAWELCLDGALVRRDGLETTLQALRSGFHIVGGGLAAAAASRHHFDRIDRTVEERQAFDNAIQGLLAEISRGRLIGAYQTGDGVARRIDGIRVRLGLPGLSQPERQRLGAILDELGAHAESALPILTAERL
jgi:hypothetical protein